VPRESFHLSTSTWERESSDMDDGPSGDSHLLANPEAQQEQRIACTSAPSTTTSVRLVEVAL